MKPLPYTSTSIVSDGIIVIAVAKVEYISNLTNPKTGITVPTGAFVRFPPVLKLTSLLSLAGHMYGVKNLIITGTQGKFQLLPTSSMGHLSAPAFTFESLYIVDGGEMIVGPMGNGDFTLTFNINIFNTI